MPRFVADAMPPELRRALNVLEGHTVPAEVLAIETTMHRSSVKTFLLTAVGQKHASTIRAGAQVTWERRRTTRARSR